jgi:tRNA A-37 threonylcarbamoyl transferase component Bud32
MAKLVIKAGQNIGSEFKLIGDHLVIGRRSACPIPIADAKASREHAAINQRDNTFFVQDLSRNGTLMNGKPVEKSEPGTPLKYGDQIRIGDTILELVDQASEVIDIGIPGYDILEKIGTGGMGIVYKARQLSMDRVVALKVLNERYSSNAEFQDRFIREARAAGRLNHPNVIHVHDISRANGRHYFSMEYIDGSSVKDVLRSERKLDVNKALDIVLQAAKALEFAHENRIVHRDIKPDNIMLTRESIVKIADLGIAKTFEEAAPSAKEHRRIMGTPHYMAPEQALGKAIDHRVDIYSLGATFYHMVTGSTPFTGSTAHEVLKAHIQESLPPIQDLNSNVPDPVCFIIERMMAKLPEKRYPDMSKVIEDIERVQRGVVAGIHRIEAGDSTIMRAIRAKSAARQAANKAEEAEDNAATGAQAPISIGNMALIIALAFAACVGTVMFAYRNKENTNTVDLTSTKSSVTTSTGTGTDTSPKGPRSDAVAKKLLEEAIAADAAKNRADYKSKLNTIKSQYGASLEAIDAEKRLKEVAELEAKEQKQKVETLFAKAKEFDAANTGKFADIIKQYDEVAKEAAVANMAEIRTTSESRIEALQKQMNEELAKQLEADYKTAVDAADGAKTKLDFDSSRKTLQDFIAAHPQAKQKDDAQKLLDQLNADAKARLADVQKKSDASEIPEALRAWDEYTKEVKDQASAGDVDKARQALKAKADELTKAETDKAGKKAHEYHYDEAIQLMDALEKKVKTTEFEVAAKARRDSFAAQKDLHEKALKIADEKMKKDGPVHIDFHEDPAFKNDNIKWQLSGISGDTIQFDTGKGMVIPKKLSSLPAPEQYQFHKLFQPDDHRGLLELCKELNLAKEAEAEQTLASKAKS